MTDPLCPVCALRLDPADTVQDPVVPLRYGGPTDGPTMPLHADCVAARAELLELALRQGCSREW